MTADHVLVTYADVQQEAWIAFRAWHERDHFPRLLECPGFISGSGFESIGGEPMFLTIFELESPDAISTSRAREALRWHPWGRLLRGWHRRVYRRIFQEAGEDGETDSAAPFLLTVRVDIVATDELQFNRWYNDVHIPEVLGCPGFLRAARWESLEGEPRFLALYDLDRADVLSTPEMKSVYGFGPMEPCIRSEHGRIYARRF